MEPLRKDAVETQCSALLRMKSYFNHKLPHGVLQADRKTIAFYMHHWTYFYE